MTKQILVGGVPVGGGAPVTIQSMTNTRTDDVQATVDQILRLEEAGCQIIRVAVPDMAAAKAVGAIKAGIHTHKGPDSLKRTPLYEEGLQQAEKTVFTGSTKEAIALLPTKVNVAVASALASIGPEKATATITSVPGFIGDDHCITVETEGLKAVADIYSATSDIAAWSIVALLRNLASPMVFF